MKIYKAAASGQRKGSRIFPAVMLTFLLFCSAGQALGMGLSWGDPEVNFVPAEQVVSEEAGTATITVQLTTMDNSSEVSVPFTLSGTALGEGIDFSISPNPVIIPVGQYEADITVTIVGDNIYENDETVVLTMGDPVNASKGVDTVHTLTITDNDLLTFPEVSLPKYHLLSPVAQLLTSPTDVTLDSNGRIYITDSYTNRVVVLSQGGSLIGTINKLANPISVAVDDAGRIFVGNNDLGNVQVFDTDFNPLYTLGAVEGEFSQPNDIAVDAAGKVYVVDRWNHFVKVYNAATGAKIADVGGLGTNAGQFTRPLSIVVDTTAQEIIVLDNASGARVQVFDMNWSHLRSFSKFGYYEGEMIWPKQIAVDSMSRLFVTDAQLNVALAYDKYGNFINVVKDTSSNPLLIPMGLAIGEANILYIASHTTGKVEAFGVYEEGIYGYTGMRLSKQELNLEVWEGGKNPAPQAINIFNSGNTDLNWTAVEDVNWLSLAGKSGLIEPVAGNKDTLGITFMTQGMAAGEYHGYITISGGPGVSEVVDVRLTIKAMAKLSVKPYTMIIDVEQGVPSTDSKITIGNSGSLPLHWTVTEAPDWLYVTKLSGAIPGSGSEEVTLLPDTSLDAGMYTGTLIVTSKGAFASPGSIEVVLNICDQKCTTVVDPTESPVVEPTPPDGKGLEDILLTLSGTLSSMSLNDVWTGPGYQVFAVGDDGIILHYDGTEWSIINKWTDVDLYGVWGFIDTVTSTFDVYAVGEGGMILHYDGVTWQTMASSGQDLHGVWGASATDVYAVGQGGAILHYNGTNWSSMSSITGRDLHSVWGMYDSSMNVTHVYAVGDGGTILHYNDAQWGRVKTSSKQDLYGVWGIPGYEVYAVGGEGTILKSHGSKWIECTNKIAEGDLHSIWGTSASDIYAVGSEGAIIHYDGKDWSTMNSTITNDLQSIHGSLEFGMCSVGLGFDLLYFDSAQWQSLISADGN